MKAGKINPSDNMSCCWIDAGNAVLKPDVCKDFSVDEFKLVEFVDVLHDCDWKEGNLLAVNLMMQEMIEQ